MVKKTFQMSEVRSMSKIKPQVYKDDYVYLSSHGSIELVLITASKFHEMEREIQKLKAKANAQ